MFLPAYDAAREPVSNGLRCVARLHLKWLAETLAIIAGIPYVAFCGKPQSPPGGLGTAPLLPLPFLAAQSPSKALRPHPQEARRVCRAGIHVTSRNLPRGGTFRGQDALAPGDVSRARVGVYGSVRTRRRRPAASPAAPTPPCRSGNPKRSDV